MATIERRGNSYRLAWRLGGSRDGGRQSASFTSSSPARAKKLAEDAKTLVVARQHRITREELLRAILGEDKATPIGALTLVQWVKLWAKDREPVNPDRPGMDDIQPDTLAGYVYVLNLRILPYLGHKFLHEIDEETVKDWIKALKATRVRRTKANSAGRPISAQSVRSAHGILHMVLGAAVPKHIVRNPCARPANSGARKSRNGLPKAPPFEGMALTPPERTRIWKCCDEQIKDLWLLLTNTGLRLGEALVLRPCDVTVTGDEPEIRVTRALKKGQRIGWPKSEKSRRVVGTSTEVAEMLARRCKGKRPNDLIFSSPGRGKRGEKRRDQGLWRENNLNRRHWAPAVAAAMRCEEHPPPEPPKPKSGPRRKLRPDEVSTCGCPHLLRRRPRMYDGRHSHATDLIRNGWELHDVQERLGHASPLTTLTIYTHAWKSHGNRARLDAMAKRLAASGSAAVESLVEDEES